MVSAVFPVIGGGAQHDVPNVSRYPLKPMLARILENPQGCAYAISLSERYSEKEILDEFQEFIKSDIFKKVVEQSDELSKIQAYALGCRQTDKYHALVHGDPRRLKEIGEGAHSLEHLYQMGKSAGMHVPSNGVDWPESDELDVYDYTSRQGRSQKQMDAYMEKVKENFDRPSFDPVNFRKDRRYNRGR